jgi:cellulose synthase/poly-beta-1,6-N-acetylglucosamine synthase-like glycosyltransferase
MITINQQVILFLEIVLFVFALGIFIPISVVFVECSAALFSSEKTKYSTITSRPKVNVLVPAHNEASGISATLKTLLPQLTAQDRLIVIADNCDDDTAAIARRFGVTVIERQEPNQKAKGYALDYGLRFIALDPPDVVVVIDADCIVHSGTITQLVCLAGTTGRPVQASYLMKQPHNPEPKDAVSMLAFMVKNLVRPQGLDRLGLPCLLTGSGMAFPWSVICKVSLGSNNIVEDMQLTLDVAKAGYAPIFCSQAKVTGVLPQQKYAAQSQRTRWEHGHLQTSLTQVPQLFRDAVYQKRFDLLAIALDLCVPPLSLLVMLWAASMGGALLAAECGASWIPAILLVIEGVLIFTSIVGAWVKYGRTVLPLEKLLTVPLYILWKIPIYLAFLLQRQTKWIRTQRDTVERH